MRDVELERCAEAVRGAALRSLAATGVSACRVRVRQTDGGWTDPWSWEIGLASPVARLARWESHVAEGSPIDKLAKAAERRWPWMQDTEPVEQSTQSGYETIEIERAVFGGGPGGWSQHDGPLYLPSLGLWPLEALLATTSASQVSDGEVRGEQCERYLGQARPGDLAGWHDVRLIDAPEPNDDWQTLSTDVSIDSHGLIRRIGWSATTGKRWRPGLLLRLAERGRTSAPAGTNPSDGRLWTVIEFWDYGRDVTIAAPEDLITPSDMRLRYIARDLWQMRREYKRRASAYRESS